MPSACALVLAENIDSYYTHTSSYSTPTSLRRAPLPPEIDQVSRNLVGGGLVLSFGSSVRAVREAIGRHGRHGSAVLEPFEHGIVKLDLGMVEVDDAPAGALAKMHGH